MQLRCAAGGVGTAIVVAVTLGCGGGVSRAPVDVTQVGNTDDVPVATLEGVSDEAIAGYWFYPHPETSPVGVLDTGMQHFHMELRPNGDFVRVEQPASGGELRRVDGHYAVQSATGRVYTVGIELSDGQALTYSMDARAADRLAVSVGGQELVFHRVNAADREVWEDIRLFSGQSVHFNALSATAVRADFDFGNPTTPDSRAAFFGMSGGGWTDMDTSAADPFGFPSDMDTRTVWAARDGRELTATFWSANGLSGVQATFTE